MTTQISQKITLIKQDPNSNKIWNVNLLDRSEFQILIQNSKAYKIEVDCDLDTFVLFENIPTNERIPDRLFLRSENEIEKWIENFFSNKQKGNFLIPAIAQDKKGRILMQAWANEEAFRSALNSGKATYFSRSRNKLWIKGEESGHFQKNLEWEIINSNPISVIYHTDQIGAACHTGEYTCFFREFKTWEDPSLIKM